MSDVMKTLPPVVQKATWVRDHVPGTITSVVTRDPVAALTFNDGPHPEYTSLLLDILERHQARATFFMVGKAAQRYPQLVQQVAQAGHAIGNHSWDHPFFPSLPSLERRRQILTCEQALAPNRPRLFRAPYGAESLASHLDAVSLHYNVVAWNLDAEDWIEQDPEWMTDLLMEGIQPGSIVLLHDAVCGSQQSVKQHNREPMLTAVTLFLERLGGRFSFVTIPELLRHGRPQYHNWHVQSGASS
jgi:peptidoglycan/xylan/chitin deacetylase (PgdA/CDA1 family)